MTDLNVRDLLLAPALDREQVIRLLTPRGLKDVSGADANLQSMAGTPAERQMLADVLEPLLAAVSRSAIPDRALVYLERFVEAALNRRQLFSYLGSSPQALDILAGSAGGSPYLAEILIRDPQNFYWVTDPQILSRRRRKREIQRDLVHALRSVAAPEKQLDYVRSVKRREMLHIGVRDLLRLASVEETLAALSDLAEALLTGVYWICASALRREYSLPREVFSGFTILAMGKLGGSELNFSSDVDLIYLYDSDREAAGDLHASDYFRALARRITTELTRLTSEGYVYRVDLRLRPEGDSGDIVLPLDGYERYCRSRLRTWERLALVKARPVAGNRRLGRAFLDMAEGFTYALPLDDAAREDVLRMKREIDRKMAARGESRRNVKLGTGGIREIELIVQSLQVRHAASLPRIRGRNTLQSLRSLHETALISIEDHETLRAAYIFLRDVENKLQMVHDAQTHVLPQDPDELDACARLLGYPDADPLRNDYQRHTSNVHRIFELHFR